MAIAQKFVSDPKKPVPYRAKATDSIDEEYMSEDQRFAARRPDVLTYTDDVLNNDLTLAGTLSGVEMGLKLAHVPYSPGGVAAALDHLASTSG